LLSGTGGEPRLGQFDLDANSGHQPWEWGPEDRLISPHDCRFVALSKNYDAGNRHAYAGEAVITVESGPGALKAGPEKSWRIVRFEVVKATETTLPGMSGAPGARAKKGPSKIIPKSK
jgi:hypothetical protein